MFPDENVIWIVFFKLWITPHEEIGNFYCLELLITAVIQRGWGLQIQGSVCGVCGCVGGCVLPVCVPWQRRKDFRWRYLLTGVTKCPEGRNSMVKACRHLTMHQTSTLHLLHVEYNRVQPCRRIMINVGLRFSVKQEGAKDECCASNVTLWSTASNHQ